MRNVTRKRNLRTVRYAAIILFIIIAGNYFPFMLKEHRENKRMDARELQYDPDGDFILIDSQSGLCGVYKATTPLKHIKIRKKNLHPGLYYLSHQETRVVLTGCGEELFLEMNSKDFYFIINNISYSAPVLIY